MADEPTLAWRDRNQEQAANNEQQAANNVEQAGITAKQTKANATDAAANIVDRHDNEVTRDTIAHRMTAIVALMLVGAVLGAVVSIVIMDLRSAVDELKPAVQQTSEQLKVGRYERIKFQREERRLTCLDLQDGDTGATSEQYAECAEDYMPLPPKPESLKDGP